MSTLATPVTWEYLEGNLHRFSARLGDPAPELVLKEGLYKMNLAIVRGKVSLDPGVLTILDLEESSFYVALMLVSMKENRRWLERRGGPFNIFSINREMRKYRKPYEGIVLAVVMVAAIVALLVNMGPSPGQPSTALLVLIGFVIALVELPFFLRFIKGMCDTCFESAVWLTGNPSAGRSFIRKYLAFYRTSRGTHSLTGWRRALFEWGCKMSIPKGI